MIDKVLTTIFGSKHERDVKRMIPSVEKINSLEPRVSALSDEQVEIGNCVNYAVYDKWCEYFTLGTKCSCQSRWSTRDREDPAQLKISNVGCRKLRLGAVIPVGRISAHWTGPLALISAGLH